MGCGSSKSVPVTPIEPSNSPIVKSKPKVTIDPNLLTPEKTSQPFQERQMAVERVEENGGLNKIRAYNGIQDKMKQRRKEISPPRKGSGSGRKENMSFEVAATDAQAVGGDSLIKKFPPKKFQKLEEQQHSEQVTQELLEEKQAVAERRRKEMLNQRIKSAKNTSARSAQARARAAQSKEVDKLIMAEEQELESSASTKDLPPLTNLRNPSSNYFNHHRQHRGEDQDSSSLHSYSTLSSATTTRSTSNTGVIVSPNQSATYLSRQQHLQQKYDEEYQQLKEERVNSEAILM